jgi:hypothetical protein
MIIFSDVAVMVEAASTSEMSVNYQTTRRKIPEDSHLHTRRRENLKYHMETVYFSETVVSTSESTRRCNLEYHHQHLHRRENFKSHIWNT